MANGLINFDPRYSAMLRSRPQGQITAQGSLPVGYNIPSNLPQLTLPNSNMLTMPMQGIDARMTPMQDVGFQASQAQPSSEPQGFRQRARGILGSIGGFFQNNPDLLDTLAIGFGGMSMNPNQALMQQAAGRIQQRQELARIQGVGNRTAEYFRSVGRDDLAQAVESNPELASAIYQEYLKSTLATPDAIDPTADMQNYKYYYDQEIAEGRTPMSFQEFRTSRPPSTQNIFRLGDEGQIQVGPIPQGYYLDTSGAAPTLKVIPGGPADIEQQESEAQAAAAQEQEQGRQQLASTAGNVVIEDIRRFKNLVSNQGVFTPVTGITGAILRQLPSTPAADAENLGLTIRANIGFDRLQQMREASPTGGALGNVSDREVATLQSVLGSLSTSQSDQQLLENLNRLETIYEQILTKLQAYPNADEYGYGAPSTLGSQQMPSDDPAGIL